MQLWLAIQLDGPPQGKGRARSFKTKKPEVVNVHGRDVVVNKTGIGHYTPETTKRYELSLGRMAQVEMARNKLKIIPRERWVKCEIDSVFAIPLGWLNDERRAAIAGEIRPVCKPDWDNIAKVTDALNKIVWVDDAQVASGHVEKWYGEQSFLQVKIYI